MKKPIDEVEKEFNKGGIFFLEQGKLSDPYYQGDYIGVHIEIAVMSETPVTAPDFAVSVLNRRDVAILFTDWRVFERDGQTILGLCAYQRLPEGTNLPTAVVRYMSFLDLCFYAGNEAIPEVYGEDIFTKPDAGYKPGDLGWTMPSRFVDAFIDAFGKLDSTMLGGNAKEALLYGPIRF